MNSSCNAVLLSSNSTLSIANVGTSAIMIRRSEFAMLTSVWLNSNAAKSFRNSVTVMFGTRLYGIIVGCG